MEKRIFGADFETTVFEGQTRTDVWLAGACELYTEEPVIFGNINDLYEYFRSLKCNVKAYFHNLKFDGAFWLDYFLNVRLYRQALIDVTKDGTKRWEETRNLTSKSFKLGISSRGQWYSIVVKEGKFTIEFVDSLKLLPFSLRQIGKAFKTKHQKLEMEYKGLRFPNCPVTEVELEYFKNDLFVLKEGLEFMYDNGHSRLTIGACCLTEYRQKWFKEFYKANYWSEIFPDQTTKIRYNGKDLDITYDQFVRKSYKGGWCYLAKGKEGKVFKNGCTADVTSLYPSMMHSKSGNRYPIGKPNYWEGDYIPDNALLLDRYYFIKLKLSFRVKDGYLPCIQIKDSFNYSPTEWLETSDILVGEEYKRYILKEDGALEPITVELTLTKTDWELIQEHYHVDHVQIIAGVWYYTDIGLFDAYIEHYKNIKDNSTGAMRELAKLFLNNLYGKFATSDDSSFKYAYLDENGIVKFDIISEHQKKTVYIPIGSAITSYSRAFTIRAAQANYHGADKPGFIYADTDSIHCDLTVDKLVDVPISKNDLCTFKIESKWDFGYFLRQKTYIECCLKNNEMDYDIKCAGMPDRCKELLKMSFTGKWWKYNYDSLDEEQLDFLFENGEFNRRTLKDFKYGLNIPGKLLPKRIAGGIILKDSPYVLRKKGRI